jgi:hypothetical protein
LASSLGLPQLALKALPAAEKSSRSIGRGPFRDRRPDTHPHLSRLIRIYLATDEEIIEKSKDHRFAANISKLSKMVEPTIERPT